MDRFICFSVFVFLWISVLAQDECVPGGTNHFDWTYDDSLTLAGITWKFDGVDIMEKGSFGEALPIPGTDFEWRITESSTYNAGLVLTNISSADSGTFSVTVVFDGAPQYDDSTTLTASETLFDAEIMQNYEIMVNGEQKPVDETNHTVEETFSFTFTIDDTAACIPEPDNIRIMNGDDVPLKTCSGYSCKVTDIEENSVIYVIVEELPMTVRLPSDTGVYTFNGAVIQSGSLLSTLLLSVLVLLSSV